MNIFQLFIYSCVTVNGMDGALISKTCRWEGNAFYQLQASCERAGQSSIGALVLSDTADGRAVEGFRCAQVWVQ